MATQAKNVKGVKCSIKLLKVNADTLGSLAVNEAIITLGGSPTNVATPPVSDRIASAINGGIALIFILSHILIVIGAIRMIAVTLSITTEIKVVKVPKYTTSIHGSPFDSFVAFIATNSKKPHISSIAAKIIIPTNNPITLKSIAVNKLCSQ